MHGTDEVFENDSEKARAIMRSDRKWGFTLIELMIVLAIVGILAAIAFPSYQSSIRKGHRAEAQAYLMDLAQRQQQYFTDNRAYATSVADLNDPMASTVSLYYTDPVVITTGTIAVPGQTNPPSFTITVTAKGSQVSDGNLKIDSTGAKVRLPASGTENW